MVDTSKKPYVRYRLHGKIGDKGVGFAIKQAVQTFMASHGYEARIVGFNATSDAFNTEVELYDNGKLDFNAKALYEHIINSGRMPTNTKYKPSVEISPLPCDHNIEEKSRDNEGLVKTIEKLGIEIKDRERDIESRDTTISSLMKTLGERQNSLNFAHKKVKDLEEQLNQSIPAQHDHPLPALLYHYLSRHSETVSESLYQWDNLTPREQELFLKLGTESEISYFRIFNEITGTNFQSDSELKKWQEHWKAVTEDGKENLPSDPEKELHKYKDEQIANLGILDFAMKTGASSELIQSVQKVIEERKQSLLALEEAVHQEEQKRTKDREAYLKSNEVETVYQKITELFTYSMLRAVEEKVLPFIVIKSKDNQLMGENYELYCPFTPVNGKEDPSLLKSLAHYLVTEGNAESISVLTELPEGIRGFSIQYNSSMSADTEQKIKDYLVRKPELKALGLEPKLVSLQLDSL